MAIPGRFLDRLRDVSLEIHDAQRPMRVLRAVAWPDEVMHDFFARGADALPRVTYEAPRFERSTTVARLRALAARVPGDNELEGLLRDTCASYELTAEMLGAVGTRRFWELSRELYGGPASVSCDGRTTNLALARHFDGVLAQYARFDLASHGEVEVTPDQAAAELARRFRGFFAGHTIRVEVVDGLSANAVAGSEVVKLNRAARFTQREVDQLEHHEGYVHVATTLNGRAQPILGFLGTGAPRTTRTQEGLAIFAEFISQTIDPDRLRRLTDRILAIQMAEEGASFVDLYRYFLSREQSPRAAYDSARRVCRGGLVEGGAPFTKDVVYLDGLLRVSNFLRVALTRGRPELVELLFAGKLDLADVPILAQLRREGVLEAPLYLPTWARDLRFLTAYMSFSAFLAGTDLDATTSYYDDLFARAETAFPTAIAG